MNMTPYVSDLYFIATTKMTNQTVLYRYKHKAKGQSECASSFIEGILAINKVLYS